MLICLFIHVKQAEAARPAPGDAAHLPAHVRGGLPMARDVNMLLLFLMYLYVCMCVYIYIYIYICIYIYIYIYIWLPEARDDLLHEVGVRSEGHREAAQERHERRAEGPADERGAEAVCLSTSLSLSP